MQEDLILKYIAEHSIAHPTDLEERFEGAYTALLNLQKYHLIELAVGRKYSVTLTKEGVRASTLGFEQYLKSVNIEEQIDNRRQWQRELIISIISTLVGTIVGSVLTYLLG